MAYTDPVSYIFGGTSGTPSLAELQRRRAVATAQAARARKAPTTLGEGMTYLGEAVGDRLESNRLSEAERAFAAAEDARLGVPPGTSTAYPRVGGAAPAAPVATGARRVPTERIAPDAAPAGAVPGSRAEADPLDRITAALMTSPQEVAQMDPTQGALQAPLGSQSDDDVEGWKRSIGGIESSNDYGAVGVMTKHGQALGRYGVMEVNVPKWTQEALGQPLTRKQFLADSDAQDAVFKHKFGGYVAKYGLEKAARAWYGGEGNINNLNATDAHEKLSVHDYGRDFIKRLRGKRAEADEEAPAPIQLASLGGAGGTMTDAPPIGMGGSAAQQRPSVAPEEPDPTVVEDIRPMQAPNQIAQLGPEMFSPRRMSDAPVAMGPNPVPLPAAPRAPTGRPAVPADLPPSLTPIPPASEQVMADPGPPPVRPGQLDISPQQRAWLKVINHRDTSEYAKEYAQQQFNLLEKRRTEQQAIEQQDYVDTRERWQQRKDAFDKHTMTADDRRTEQLNKRLTAEKAQRELVVLGPLEEQIKGIERDLKQAEKEGIPDAIAKRKADLNKALVDYAIAQRTLNEPKTLDTGGARMIAPYTPGAGGAPGTYGPYTLAPGSPPPKEEAATEPQQKAIQFVLRTREDLSTLERDHGKAITNKFEAAKSWVPFGANLIHSDEYRKARNAVDNWGAAFMSHVSGAAITPSEAARQLPAFVPAAGDDDKELAEKTRRRRQFTDAVEASGGKPTHDAIMKVLKEAGDSEFTKEGRKPPVLVRSPEEARTMEAAGTLMPGRRITTPDGRTITVPLRASP